MNLMANTRFFFPPSCQDHTYQDQDHYQKIEMIGEELKVNVVVVFV